MTADPVMTWAPAPIVLLRSTGLGIDYLGQPQGASTVVEGRRVMVLRNEMAKHRSAFVERLFPHEVDAAQAVRAGRATFKVWYRARRDVERGSVPGLGDVEISPETSAWLEVWTRLVRDLATANGAFRDAYRAAVVERLTHLRSVARDPRFREAVFLASQSMDRALERYPESSVDERVRRVDEQVYGYLQRFTTKNDTASLYGPIDHGYVHEEAAGASELAIEPYASVPQRVTRSAYWVAERYARLISIEPEITPDIPIRLADGLAFDPTTGALRNSATGRVHRLADAERRVLRLIQGGATFRTLPDEEAAAAAHKLVDRGVLVVTVQVPTAVVDAMEWLRVWLETVPRPGGATRRWLDEVAVQQVATRHFPLAPLPEKRSILARAAQAFSDVTGEGAHRRAGELYADRYVLYDEAWGGVSCRMSQDFLNRLGRRIAPAMDLCASYSLAVQRQCRRVALDLMTATGESSMPYLRFVRLLLQKTDLDCCLNGGEPARFRVRLYDIVDRHTSGIQAQLTPADLTPLIDDVPPRTMISPDVFLVAPDIERLAADDVDVVIGEVHHGAQVWTHLTSFWPDPEATGRALDLLLAGDDRRRDPTGPCPVSVVHARTQGKTFPKEFPGLSVEFGGRSIKESTHVLRVGDLEVRRREQRIALYSPVLGRELEPYPGDPRSIVNWVFGSPPVMVPPPPSRTTSPRLRVGGAVLWRRGWLLDRDRLRVVGDAPSPEGAMLELQGIWAAAGIPTRAFAALDTERKPIYCDVDDPVSVAHFLTRLRGADAVRVTELSPDPENWWLNGQGDGRRSCEWRTTWIRQDTAS